MCSMSVDKVMEAHKSFLTLRQTCRLNQGKHTESVSNLVFYAPSTITVMGGGGGGGGGGGETDRVPISFHNVFYVCGQHDGGTQFVFNAQTNLWVR